MPRGQKEVEKGVSPDSMRWILSKMKCTNCGSNLKLNVGKLEDGTGFTIVTCDGTCGGVKHYWQLLIKAELKPMVGP